MNQELIEKAAALGFEYERVYRGCGQCTIAALEEAFGLGLPEVFKAATAFAGGVGQTCDGGCGGYLGGAMVISSLRGRERSNFADPEGIRRESLRMTRRLHDRFIQEYGSTTCRNIHTRIFGRPFYILDPDELAKFDAAGAHADKCTSVVANAVRWTAEIILDEGLVQG